MNRDELLKMIEVMSSQQIVTKEDLMGAFEKGQKVDIKETRNQSNLSQLLYYIGGGIVFIGISILIGQHWSSLHSAARIFLTLGVGIGFFMTAVFARQSEDTSRLSQAFFFISGLLLPIGVGITFDAAGLHTGETGVQTMASIILFAGFIAAYAIYQESVLLLFTIIFGTWLYSALTELLMSHALNFGWRFECYRSLVVFISYLCLGYYYFLKQERPVMMGWLLGVGSFGFLAVTFALGGWKPNQSLFYELIYPVITFGFLYASIHLKNRTVLFFGASALVVYLAKITSEYFADSLGWPLTLVLLGMVIILIGYWAVYINKNYIVKDS